MRNWLVLTALWIGACSAGGGDDDDDPRKDDIPEGPGTQGCGETEPVIDTFAVEYVGFHDFDGGSFPTLSLQVDVSDEDGDLHYYEFRVWWDELIDGAVATEGFYAETYGTIDQDDCKVFSTKLTMYLGLAGGQNSPPYSTVLEFGSVVRDDRGNESGSGVASLQVFTTPDSDGNF